MKREDIAVHIIDDLKEIAVLTSDENGAQRVAWTPTWKMAAEWFAAVCRLLHSVRYRALCDSALSARTRR